MLERGGLCCEGTAAEVSDDELGSLVKEMRQEAQEGRTESLDRSLAELRQSLSSEQKDRADRTEQLITEFKGQVARLVERPTGSSVASKNRSNSEVGMPDVI